MMAPLFISEVILAWFLQVIVDDKIRNLVCLLTKGRKKS